MQARERRRELQRMRALMSYHEEKCRRAKKIKSKRYHGRGRSERGKGGEREEKGEKGRGNREQKDGRREIGGT